VLGIAGQCAEHSVLCSAYHSFVYHILIGVECSVLTVGLWNLGPQALGTLTATSLHLKGNHLTRRGVHGAPSPRLGRFRLHATGPGIRFHLQAPDHDMAVMGERDDGIHLTISYRWATQWKN